MLTKLIAKNDPAAFAAALSNADEDALSGETLKGVAISGYDSVSYTHLRAHETVLDLVCRLLLEKKK